MEYIVVCLAALLASALTLFSGFGLGTLLMPVVAIFFPLNLAIAITAIVHLLNNLFKFALVGSQANSAVVIKFGIPALFAAFIGAGLLNVFASVEPIYKYFFFGSEFQITLINLSVGILILIFLFLDFSKSFKSIALPMRWLPVGGIVTGFLGGFSGHQGAFRSMFLLNLNLSKEAFISTGVVIAVVVDIARLFVYGVGFYQQSFAVDWSLTAAASLSAFIGAFLAVKCLKKVTYALIRITISVILFVVSIGLISGLI